MIVARRPATLRQLASITTAVAVTAFWFTLYHDLPIGLAAIRSGLSRSLRFLLPLGGLFLLGSPLKYVLGERTGGVAVLVAFGLGWLAIAALLWFEDAHPPPVARLPV